MPESSKQVRSVMRRPSDKAHLSSPWRRTHVRRTGSAENIATGDVVQRRMVEWIIALRACFSPQVET